MIDLFFLKINAISVVCILVTTIFVSLIRLSKGLSVGLDDVMSPALASATVPTGISLIICAFNPSYIPKLEQMNMYLSVAGVVVIFLAFSAVKNSLASGHNKSMRPIV